MSDPFSDIDQEVTLDKLKKFFYKFKKIILISAIGIVILVSFIFYTNHNTNYQSVDHQFTESQIRGSRIPDEWRRPREYRSDR